MATNFQSTVPPWLTVTTTWPGTYVLPVVSCCVYGMPQIVSCAIAVSAALSVKRTTVRLTRLTPTISCRPPFSDGSRPTAIVRSGPCRCPLPASTSGGIGGYGRSPLGAKLRAELGILREQPHRLVELVSRRRRLLAALDDLGAPSTVDLRR